MNIRFVNAENNKTLTTLKSPGPEGGIVHVPRLGEWVVIGRTNYIVSSVASYLKTSFTTEPEVFVKLMKHVFEPTPTEKA